jgi:hypothetical protein
MATFNIEVSDSLVEVIDKEAREDGFSSTGDFVSDALDRRCRERLNAKLQVGVDELDAGLGILVTPEYWQLKKEKLLTRSRAAGQ